MDPDPPSPSRVGSQGALLGCLAAGAFAAVVAFPFLFVLAWSGAHCEPVPQCQRSAERTFLIELAVILALAALVGLAVRALFNWSRLHRLDPEAAGPAPAWAIAAMFGLGLLAAMALLGFWV